MRRFEAISGLVGVLALSASTLAQANLITNGGFDNNANGWAYNPGSSCTAGGWAAGVGNPGGAVILNSCGGAGADPGTDPRVSQQVSGLVVGATYVLAWDEALFDTSNNGALSFGVYLDGTLLVENGLASGTGEWHSFTKTFVATASTQRILFAAELRNTDISYRVDNVSLVAAIPEPGSLALVGLGLLGCAYMRRHRA